jgi:hypothetical protein
MVMQDIFYLLLRSVSVHDMYRTADNGAGCFCGITFQPSIAKRFWYWLAEFQMKALFGVALQVLVAIWC